MAAGSDMTSRCAAVFLPHREVEDIYGTFAVYFKTIINNIYYIINNIINIIIIITIHFFIKQRWIFGPSNQLSECQQQVFG